VSEFLASFLLQDALLVFQNLSSSSNFITRVGSLSRHLSAALSATPSLDQKFEGSVFPKPWLKKAPIRIERFAEFHQQSRPDKRCPATERLLRPRTVKTEERPHTLSPLENACVVAMLAQRPQEARDPHGNFYPEKRDALRSSSSGTSKNGPAALRHR